MARVLETLGRDIRFAARRLLRRPAFTGLTVLLLASGIGAAVTAFGQINAVMWKDLPVRGARELRQLQWTSPQRAFAGNAFGPSFDSRIAAGELISTFSYPVYERVRDDATRFSDVACWGASFVHLAEAGRLQLNLVSGNYFRALGVRTTVGRALEPDDDRASAPPVAVLGHRYWQRAFSGDVLVLDRTLTINGVAFAIVGIAPDGFFGFDATHAPDVFVPITAHPAVTGRAAALQNARDWTTCHIVARLRIGSGEESARAEAEAIWRAVQVEPGDALRLSES